MAFTTSPNMLLIIPAVGNEQGPQYAFDINASLTLVDQHDHSPGKGVQITPAGININTTLNFNGNAATNLKEVDLVQQASASTNLGALSSAPGGGTGISDLYYTDFAGNQIQITKSGQVNVIASSIPGESYSAVSGTFIWTQTQSGLPTTPANFDIGSITLRPNSAAAGTQLVAPTSGNYTINLPVPMPEGPAGVPNFVTMDGSGNQTNTYYLDNSTLNASGNAIEIKPGGITSTQINASANIVGTQLSPTANIVGTQLSPTAGIVGTQLANNTISQSNLVVKSGASPSAGPTTGNVAIGQSTGAFSVTTTTITTINDYPKTTQTTTITAATPAVFTVANTSSLFVGQPVIFTGGGIAGTSFVSGTVYYISNIGSITTFNVSSAPFGASLANSGAPASGVTSTFNTTAVAISTNGSPVQLQLIPTTGAGTNRSFVGIAFTGAPISSMNTIFLFRNGTQIMGTEQFAEQQNTAVPVSISYIDPVPAGNYTYTLVVQAAQATGGGDTTTAELYYATLTAYEL